MKRITKYFGVLATGMVVMAMPSCTDSWDDHYNSGAGSSASQTLWEQIEANPELSKFASIAEKAIYYKDQVHPLTDMKTGKPYTYKDVFSGTQIMTVWAPENSVLSDSEVSYWMGQLEENPFTVHQQLMTNCISLWRNIATGGGIDTLQMINGKRMIFDKEAYTMQGQKMNTSTMNTEASNGMLHPLQGKIPFEYNIYEYIKDAANATANNVERFHKYVLDTDTIFFNEANSIEGNPDVNGNPTYVDSAYTNTNTMFESTKRLTTSNKDKNLTFMESFGANIVGEDSDFIMVIPQDAAWEAAYEKLKPLYNYANKYVDSEKGNSNVTAYREITEDMMDSLKNQSINMDIISPLCFNAHKQPKRAASGPLWTSEELLNAPDANIEYLLNTYGDTLRSDDEWTKTSIWEGQKQVKMSNGYGIVAESWNIPRKLYNPNLNIEVGWRSFYNTAKQEGTATSVPFVNGTAVAWADTVGTVTFDNFYNFTPSSDNNPINVSFRLVGTDGDNVESEVMSGTYDICVVCVPDFYMTSSDTIEGDTIRHKIIATLNYCNNAANGKDAQLKIVNKDAKVYDGLKVDTITLFKDFTFPYSYKNLRHCYPTLTIGTYSTSADRDKKKTNPIFKNNLCIDQILLISKEGNKSEDEE